MQGLTKYCVNDVTWYVPAGQEVLLEDLKKLTNFSEGDGVTILKKGKRKSFAHLEATVNGNEVYLKTFQLKGIFHCIKHLFFKSKAVKELEVSLAAKERGVPVLLPLAAGERYQNGLLRESYLVIKRLPEAVDLLEYLLRQDVKYRYKSMVIEALGKLSRKTHDEGILQEDFALNNFLLSNTLNMHNDVPLSMENADFTPQKAKADCEQVFLIDFERTRVRPKLCTKEKEWTLAKLNRIGANFTLTDKFRFLWAYCKTREEFKDLPRWKKLEKYTYQILKRDAKRIFASCIRGDRGYTLYKDNMLTGYFLKGYQPEELLTLIKTRQWAEEGHRWQFSISRRRGRIRKGEIEEAVLVYEFNAQQRGLPLAKRAWQCSNGLLKGYFPVSPPVAAVEWKQKEGYRGALLLKELKKAEDIRDVLRRCPPSIERRHSIFWHTARFLSRLHNFGTFAGSIFPKDISWVEDRTWGSKLFLTQPYNFVMKKGLKSREREIDIQRLEEYLQGMLSEEERDYLREQYWRYANVIS
ncbi:MAG TPA: lipopolysaccharide kinase InaA family protein [Candidatus Hypogeohydataceae bacterium YC41]